MRTVSRRSVQAIGAPDWGRPLRPGVSLSAVDLFGEDVVANPASSHSIPSPAPGPARVGTTSRWATPATHAPCCCSLPENPHTNLYLALCDIFEDRLEHSSTLFLQFGIADGNWVGAVHAWRGENDQAFEWIARATRGGDSSVVYLPFDPPLSHIRSDPRYVEALKAIGFAPAY